ncbi:MAG TPA: cyclic nucleotide-binding domain-containing protein [Alphaproteobacteria bacterium]|jgi:CRP-like cAMP-binding protein
MMVEKKANNKDTIILERRFVPQGAVIVKEGDLGSNAFLIQSGQVRVTAGHGAGREVELAIIGVGQIFGEMALVFDEPRAATVTAAEDCNLIVITRETLNHKLNKSDPTVKAIVPMLMKRILQANNALLAKESTLDEMTETANMIYQNVLGSLPSTQKQSLQNDVLPKLEEFLAAVKDFHARHAGK